MTKSKLIRLISTEGRIFSKNGKNRRLRANEKRLIIEAINSVWLDVDQDR